MGYYYDGVSILYFYDDNDPTGGHTAGQPHTLAEGVLSAAWAAFLTTPINGIYQCAKTIRAGDNVAGHVNQTTFQATIGEGIYFTAGSLISGAPNAAGLRWRLGNKLLSGEQMYGYLGLTVMKAGACSLQGDIQIFGCQVQATSFSLVPFDSTAADSEGAGNRFSLNQAASVGVSISRFFKSWYNNSNLNVGSTTVLAALFVEGSSGHRIVSSGVNWPSLINSAITGQRIVKVQFIAQASTVPGAAQVTSVAVPANWFVLEPSWIQPEFRKYKFGYNGLQLALGNQHFECWGLHTAVVDDSSGLPLSGIPVTVIDSIGQVQVNGALTGSDGDIAFGQDFVPGQPVTGNYLIIEDVGNWEYAAAEDYSRRYRGPFYVLINAGPFASPLYQSYSAVIDWPYSGSSRKLGQYSGVHLPVRLLAVGGIVSSWIKCEVGQID